MSKKTFADFMATATVQPNGLDPKLFERLASASAEIRSRDRLVRWARERYPEKFGANDWREPSEMRAALNNLWAEFLEWQEAPPS